MVVVIDSPASAAFTKFQNVFGSPLLFLLSPEVCPATIPGKEKVGSLFTMFLNSPLIGMCVVLKRDAQMQMSTYESAERKISEIVQAIQIKLHATKGLDESIRLLITDDLVLNLVLRFVFFSLVAQLHFEFKGRPECAPQSNPAMPESLASDAELTGKVLELAGILGDSECMK